MRVGAPSIGEYQTTERMNYSPEEEIDIAIHCMRMAITFHNQRNTELIETAVKSADMNHRIAAAWAFGLQALPKVQQKLLVINFIRTQVAKIQSIAAKNHRYGNRYVDPRLLRLLANINTLPTPQENDPQPYSNCLLLLMRDRNPYVVSAARDSCTAIANKTFNDNNVDFGPVYNARAEAKSDSAILWEIYFEKKLKGNTDEQPIPKPKTNVEEEKKEAG